MSRIILKNGTEIPVIQNVEEIDEQIVRMIEREDVQEDRMLMLHGTVNTVRKNIRIKYTEISYYHD